MREKTTLIGICHNAVENRCPSATHPASATLFGIKVVMSWDTRNNLAVLGNSQTLTVRFVILHAVFEICLPRSYATCLPAGRSVWYWGCFS